MSVIVCVDASTAARWQAEIDCTPRIEAGAGPVKLGRWAAATDGRVAIEHPFREADRDWIEAYAADSRVAVEDRLPPDWM
jgi:hypothetical protein